MIRYSAAILIVLTNNAYAQFVSGNQLLDLCGTNRMIAGGYVAGAVDTIQTVQDNKLVEKTICLRANVTVSQMTDIVCNYTQSHPDFRDFAASAQVAAAMTFAFPCAQQ